MIARGIAFSPISLQILTLPKLSADSSKCGSGSRFTYVASLRSENFQPLERSGDIAPRESRVAVLPPN